MNMTRRGFLKGLIAAPVVAIAASKLWLPEAVAQTIWTPELATAMAPVVQAVSAEDYLYGFFIHEDSWRGEYQRRQVWADATGYFPDQSDVIIIAAPNRGAFGRFCYRGSCQELTRGEDRRIVQHWKNGSALEPQLWLE